MSDVGGVCEAHGGYDGLACPKCAAPSPQAVVREALKELAAARLREGQHPNEWAPKVRAEEAALDDLCRLLLDVEGTLLAYWTDPPEAEVERLRLALRDALGDFEPHASQVSLSQDQGRGRV